jgi:hypothetical protein
MVSNKQGTYYSKLPGAFCFDLHGCLNQCQRPEYLARGCIVHRVNFCKPTCRAVRAGKGAAAEAALETAGSKELPSAEDVEAGAKAAAKAAGGAGSALPFTRVSMAFNNIRYSVPYPKVNNARDSAVC